MLIFVVWNIIKYAAALWTFFVVTDNNLLLAGLESPSTPFIRLTQEDHCMLYDLINNS